MSSKLKEESILANLLQTLIKIGPILYQILERENKEEKESP